MRSFDVAGNIEPGILDSHSMSRVGADHRIQTASFTHASTISASARNRIGKRRS